jgi:DNA polymerase III alpha subunit
VVVKPYTDVQVRKREQELFGVYLSSSPFDSIPADVMAECASVDSIENGPVAQYTVVGTVVRAKAHVDRRGRNMGFLDLHTPTGPLNMVCFADQWGRYERDLRKDTLIFATINKGGRGLSLDIVLPVNGV